MSKVSVIIPVYNGEKYLDECIMSVINQTLTDIDIIIVDDESTDNSYAIAEKYIQTDKRIQLFRQPHCGAGAARNFGVQCAKGEYLSFLDADDFFEEDMLEKAYRKASSCNADIVVFESDYYSNLHGIYIPNYFTINRDLINDAEIFSAREVKKNVFRVFTGWAWDKLFRTDFIKHYSLEYQKLRTTNDMLFVFTAQILADKIVVMDELLAHHRLTEHTLSVTREKSWHCFYEALTALRDNLEKYSLYNRYEQDYINYCMHFSLWHLRTLNNPAHNLLHMKLKDEWFDNLKVTEHSPEYFYNKKEYTEYRNICRYNSGEVPFIASVQYKMLNIGEIIFKLFYVIRRKGMVNALKWIKLMKVKIGK